MTGKDLEAEGGAELVQLFIKAVPEGTSIFSVLMAAITFSVLVGKISGTPKMELQKEFVSVWDKLGSFK